LRYKKRTILKFFDSMAKSVDVLDRLNQQMEALNQKMSEFASHQVNMIENYEILMQNQIQVAENHDLVVANQNRIIENLGIVIHNQSSIIHNQSKIVKNQAYLKTFLYAQVEILTILTDRPKSEIEKEVSDFFENAKIEIASGFENPIGEGR